MRIGIIDCGTNTFNLLVADVAEGQWSNVFTGKINVRLGKGGFSQGVLKPERLARGIDALLAHRETLLNFGTEKVIVLATSAVREATNAPDFIRKAKELVGMDVIVVDGMKEAELIYEGVRQTVDVASDCITVIDIGGGSTEFIIADASGILWKQSFAIGVSRLFEFLQPSDCLTEDEVARLDASFVKVLEPLRLALNEHPSTTLVGASGSFDTLTSMIAAARRDLPHPLANEIQVEEFDRLHRILVCSTYQQRLAIPGMLPMRADTMPLATSLIDYVFHRFGFCRMFQSSYALKEGAIALFLKGRLSAHQLEPTHDQQVD